MTTSRATSPALPTAQGGLRIQLWSYNFDPEPTGIGPLARVWAQAMRARGHEVAVVAAHPHYPEPAWGRAKLPYRELRDGVPVVRLPLWIGRATPTQRIRQEASFATALAVAVPLLGSPDVIVAVSPSFPALAPAIINAQCRRIPWVLWLQDILPDAAAATGLVDPGLLLRAARRFERFAYRSAQRIVVLSDTFKQNLRAKGVPEAKLVRIYNPASRPVRSEPRLADAGEPGVVLTMGNIGHSQNLVAVVRAFESHEQLRAMGARFVLAGDGVAGSEVRAAITTDRVRVTGIVGDEALAAELRRAQVALVSQHYEGAEFNVPSKLMNFMGDGLATVASVGLRSEVARFLTDSGGGWATPSSQPEEAMEVVASALSDPIERDRRAAAALAFARANFQAEYIAEQFEQVLLDSLGRSVTP